MDSYDVSLYFHQNLINIYSFLKVNNLNELLLYLNKNYKLNENNKIELYFNHSNIINYLYSKSNHPIYLTLYWVAENYKPNILNYRELQLYIPIRKYHKKEETYIISVIYFYLYKTEGYSFNYQYKVPFTSFVVDLLIGNNICIEVDENNHSNYNIEMEIDRSNLLTAAGYTTIHISPKTFYNNELNIIQNINFIVQLKKHSQIHPLDENVEFIDQLKKINIKQSHNKIKIQNFKQKNNHIYFK